MASIQALERRILALEARLADLEGGYGETLRRLHRASVRNELRMGRLLEHLNLPRVTDEEIDAVLDQQQDNLT